MNDESPILVRLLTSMNRYTTLDDAWYKVTTEVALTEGEGREKLGRTIAGNPYTPEHLLARLENHPDPETRRLAQGPRAQVIEMPAVTHAKAEPGDPVTLTNEEARDLSRKLEWGHTTTLDSPTLEALAYHPGTIEGKPLVALKFLLDRGELRWENTPTLSAELRYYLIGEDPEGAEKNGLWAVLTPKEKDIVSGRLARMIGRESHTLNHWRDLRRGDNRPPAVSAAVQVLARNNPKAVLALPLTEAVTVLQDGSCSELARLLTRRMGSWNLATLPRIETLLTLGATDNTGDLFDMVDILTAAPEEAWTVALHHLRNWERSLPELAHSAVDSTRQQAGQSTTEEAVEGRAWEVRVRPVTGGKPWTRKA